MKLSLLLTAALTTHHSTNTNAFSMDMNMSIMGRSALSQQYKSVMSIHNGLNSGGNSGSMSYPRMAPGEPEPEVRCDMIYTYVVFLLIVLLQL